MKFHENRLLADDSHEISCLIFFRKLGKMSQNLVKIRAVLVQRGVLKVCYVESLEPGNASKLLWLYYPYNDKLVFGHKLTDETCNAFFKFI